MAATASRSSADPRFGIATAAPTTPTTTRPPTRIQRAVVFGALAGGAIGSTGEIAVDRGDQDPRERGRDKGHDGAGEDREDRVRHRQREQPDAERRHERDQADEQPDGDHPEDVSAGQSPAAVQRRDRAGAVEDHRGLGEKPPDEDVGVDDCAGHRGHGHERADAGQERQADDDREGDPDAEQREDQHEELQDRDDRSLQRPGHGRPDLDGCRGPGLVRGDDDREPEDHPDHVHDEGDAERLEADAIDAELEDDE